MDLTVATISTTRPHAVRVFQRHGIDFCCGGGRTLSAACAQKQLDPALVLAEIAAEEAKSSTPATRWDLAPISTLIEHLLTRYHAPLAEELPRLEGLARKVHRVHGDKDPRLEAILGTFLALRADLEPHMMKEEQVLFPWILRGEGRTAVAPVRVMRHEHDEVAALLERLVGLTDGYTVPEQACGSWRALWQGLEELDRDTREHVALENNVLFPRALAGE